MYKNILITDENNEGKGICRINNKIVFVPYVIKDDIIDLNITKENKNYNEGIALELINKSENRTTPMCPYYYECGGCNIMHMNYNYQLDFKKRKVINNLKKIANIDIKNLDIEYDKDFYYRNHIILSINKDKIGFYKDNTNDIVNIDKCIISNEIINNKIEEIRKFINKYKDNSIEKISIKAYDEIIINIKAKEFKLLNEFKNYVRYDSLYINDKFIDGKDKVNILFGKFKFKISDKSFFQKNTNMALKLYNYIKDNVDNNSNVLDLYCGIGSIGIFISDKVKSVLGIEIIDDAVKDAIENSKINNINNIKFISGKTEDNLSNIKDIDVIIVDPPRTGLNKRAIENILNLNSKKVIYVSCNSTTLSRDINYFKEYYNIKSIKLFDLFPNTHHCESVCILERR